ncbi:dephospho-CoA kinase [Sphingobium fluviale]|uniref:Dephospho-CoA kinase n=2 Tax=Sphingobium fluviale TaxID=2506423 RepID=A0A4Q1KMS8_9SPHN|nr:dephospho-CoA kinase [Sphingobium fluviale]
MGKSAVTGMIRKLGVPLFDADAEVHRLQAPGGKALAHIEARFPGTTGPQGLDRAKLAAIILAHPHERKALEAIMHPLVFAARQKFLQRHIAHPLVILDIPLLFETHGEKRVDGVIVVTAPAWKQRKRVLARPGMTEAKFRRILALQMPDAQKRLRADHIVHTGTTYHRTRAQVRALIACLLGKAGR